MGRARSRCRHQQESRPSTAAEAARWRSPSENPGRPRTSAYSLLTGHPVPGTHRQLPGASRSGWPHASARRACCCRRRYAAALCDRDRARGAAHVGAASSAPHAAHALLAMPARQQGTPARRRTARRCRDAAAVDAAVAARQGSLRLPRWSPCQRDGGRKRRGMGARIILSRKSRRGVAERKKGARQRLDVFCGADRDDKDANIRVNVLMVIGKVSCSFACSRLCQCGPGILLFVEGRSALPTCRVRDPIQQCTTRMHTAPACSNAGNGPTPTRDAQTTNKQGHPMNRSRPMKRTWNEQ